MVDVRRDGFGTIFASGATPTDPTGGAYGSGGGSGTSGNIFVYRENETAPDGKALFATFDEAYVAALALKTPATIVLDDTLSGCGIFSEPRGSCQITEVVGTLATLEGMSGVLPDMVGGHVYIQYANNAQNMGTFVIAEYVSATSVKITNPAAIAPDYISFQVRLGSTGASITSVSTVVTLSNLNWDFTPVVGDSITVSNAVESGNNGTFTITAVFSNGSTVQYVNQNAVYPDGNSGSINWTSNTGNAASLSFYDSNTQLTTITGLTGITPDLVGRQIRIQTTSQGTTYSNIAEYVSPTSVKANLGTPTVPDANNGTLTWSFGGHGTSGQYGPLSAVAIVTGLTGMSSDLLYTALTLADTADNNNTGSFRISRYISPTSVEILNPNAVSNDGNNGSIYWSKGKNYDLHHITLAGISRQPYGTSVAIYDGVTWNQGVARVTNGLSVYTEFSNDTFLGTIVFDENVSLSILIDNYSVLGPDGGGGLWDLSYHPIQATLTLESGGQAFGDNQTTPFFWLGANDNVNVNIYLGSDTEIDQNIIGGNHGGVSIHVTSLSASLPTRPEFDQFGGYVNIEYKAYAGNLRWLNWSNQNLPTLQDGIPMVDPGVMIFDSNRRRPFWWNGSDWVTPERVFVYAPNGGSGAFSTFLDAYSAASAGGGAATIIIDSTYGPCFIEMGSGFDLSRITLSGPGRGIPSLVTIRNTAYLAVGLPRITGGLFVDVAADAGNGGHLFSLTDGAYTWGTTIDEGAVLQSVNGVKLFDVSNGNFQTTINFALESDGKLISSPSGRAILVGSNPAITVNLTLGEGGTVDADLIEGSAGTLAVRVLASSASFPTSFPSFNGTYSGATLLADAANEAYTPAVAGDWNVQPKTVREALDMIAAKIGPV